MPPGLDGISSRDRENISTTNPICLIILITTYAWGGEHGRARSGQSGRRSCIYIHLKIKRVSSKVTLTRLTIVIVFRCQVFVHNYWYCLTSTIFKIMEELTHKPLLLLLLNVCTVFWSQR